MSRLGSTLSTLGQVAQSAGGKIGSAMKAGKQAKDTIMASKTFKSLQGTMQGLLKVQGSMAKQSKKAGALQFLQQENEKEYQKEQMEFWSILLQKLDSIEKKLDGLGLGAGKGEKKGLLAKLWNFAMGLLGLANAWRSKTNRRSQTKDTKRDLRGSQESCYRTRNQNTRSKSRT